MADVTMTINADKTVSLSTNILGSQREHVDVLVEVDQDVVDLGYQAYVDFLLPSGLSYYKGGYDCSSGSFSMGLGELDSVMDKDGEVLMQFWVGTLVSTVKIMHWSSYVKKAYVNKSIGATSAAILPYVPQMVYPDTYPAELISLEDSAGRIGASQVEQALAEIVGLGRTTETIKGNADDIDTNATNIATNVAAIALLNGKTDSGNTIYATKDAATDSTFTVTFPKKVTGFMLFASWDGKKILSIGRYIQGVAQNSVSNFDSSGVYTFNSAQVGLLYLDGSNFVVLSCTGIVDNVATISQSKTGTCSGTLRMIFVPA